MKSPATMITAAHRRITVLEIANGVPLKAISFQSNSWLIDGKSRASTGLLPAYAGRAGRGRLGGEVDGAGFPDQEPEVPDDDADAQGRQIDPAQVLHEQDDDGDDRQSGDVAAQGDGGDGGQRHHG